MEKLIQANSYELMMQGPMTADTYLGAAIAKIDGELGEDYAKNHPALIGTFMLVAASDFNTAITCKVVENCTEQLARAVGCLESQVERLARRPILIENSIIE